MTSTHFLAEEGRGARVVLVMVVTALAVMATTLGPLTPAHAAGYAAEAVIDGSTMDASLTEAGWIASCPDLPPSQDVDGHVFELPGAFPPNAIVTAERFESDGPGEPDPDMVLYDGSCSEISRQETVRKPEKAELPTGTKWVLVIIRQSALAARNTTVCLRIGDAFCREPSGSPSMSDSASASNSPSASESSPSASASNSPSASQTVSSRPPSTASTTASSSPTSTSDTIGTTIESSRRIVGFRKRFTLSGRVEFGPECAEPFEVTLRKRTGGSERSKVLKRSIPVGADHTWRTRVRSRVSAVYSATATSPTCASRPPSSEIVRARVALTVRRGGVCTAPQRVVGRVKPRHPGTKVRLKHNAGNGYRTVGKDRLSRRSSYELSAPTCAGRFAVVWRSQSPKNASGRRRFHF